MKKCPHCAEEIQDEATVCRYCQRSVLPGAATQAATIAPVIPGWNPGLAAVLSFFIPGLGQIYKGRLGRGAAFFCGTVAGVLLLLIPGVIIWIWNIVDAYNGPGGRG